MPAQAVHPLQRGAAAHTLARCADRPAVRDVLPMDHGKPATPAPGLLHRRGRCALRRGVLPGEGRRGRHDPSGAHRHRPRVHAAGAAPGRRAPRLPREGVERRPAAYLEVFTRQSPPYREVMEGIAEASGRTLPEIAMLNARYEILYSAYSAIRMAEAAGECTAFAAARTVTADGHLWIGQTWDWIPDVRGALLDMEEDGLRILAFTEAGIAGGKIGLHSAGIGLVINGLLSNLDDWSRLGVPFHLRTSGILRSRTMSEAGAQATEGGHACSAHFLLAPGRGGSVAAPTRRPPGPRHPLPGPGAACHLAAAAGGAHLHLPTLRPNGRAARRADRCRAPHGGRPGGPAGRAR